MASNKFRLQEQFRAAFWLAALGMLAISGLVTLAVLHPENSQTVSVGITAITTLVAGAAGHAAGAAKSAIELAANVDAPKQAELQ